MKIWAKTEEFREGKYLVVRRDGTVPAWPHFVLGAQDQAAPAALETYADEAARRGFDPEYAASLRELAQDFREYRAEHGDGDPDAPPHRKDLVLAIAMMQKQVDVEQLQAMIVDLYSQLAALQEAAHVYVLAQPGFGSSPRYEAICAARGAAHETLVAYAPIATELGIDYIGDAS